jgi:tetratricopeptide (TPR) repeat protein
LANADRFPYETALVENSLANCLRHSLEYDSAIFYFEQCWALIDSAYPLYHRTAIEKAFVHFMAKDYATAMADLEIAYQSKDENLKTQSAYGLADCYEKLGDTLRAMPYYALVKTYEENKVVASNHNAEVMQMLNAYLKEKEPQKGRERLLWLLLLFVVSAVVVILMRRRHKKHMASQESEVQRRLNEASQRHDVAERELQTKVEQAAQHTKEVLEKRAMGIYLTGNGDRLQHIFDDFESVYPHAIEKLEALHPELTEQERNVVVLSFLRFRAKEMAELLGLTENTVQKYRSNIRKKVGNDPILEVI